MRLHSLALLCLGVRFSALQAFAPARKLAHSHRLKAEEPVEPTTPLVEEPPRPAAPAEDVSLKDYVFGKPGELKRDLGALGTSVERIAASIFLSSVVAFGGNLGGVTSAALSTMPVQARSLGLDLLYPVAGFKRYRDPEDRFEFIYPYRWLEDQAVVLARTTARAGNPAEPILGMKIPRRVRGVIPRVAFGPAGREDALENVSVIKQTLLPGFSLRGTLGEPEEAAQKLLDSSIAPPGSGKDATLVRAQAARRNSLEEYEFEWTVEGALSPRTNGNKRFAVHTTSIITAKEDELYTLAVITPQDKWGPEAKATAEAICESFAFR